MPNVRSVDGESGTNTRDLTLSVLLLNAADRSSKFATSQALFVRSLGDRPRRQGAMAN